MRPKENPGKHDIDLCTAVIQEGYLLSGNTPIPMDTWHTQLHDRTEWHFEPSLETLFESHSSNIWIRYKKTSHLPVSGSSVFEPDTTTPLPALKII